MSPNLLTKAWWPPIVVVDPEKLRAARAKRRRRLPPDRRTLPGMPQELLLKISSYLDQKSRICLSLTCIRLFNDLPRPPLGSLNPKDGHRSSCCSRGIFQMSTSATTVSNSINGPAGSGRKKSTRVCLS